MANDRQPNSPRGDTLPLPDPYDGAPIRDSPSPAFGEKSERVMGSVLRVRGSERCDRSNEIVVALDGTLKGGPCADLTRLRSLNRHSASRRSGRSAAFILALVGVSLASFARGQVVTEFPIPTASSFPYGIAAGPDGNLWFAEVSGLANKIGRITTAGVVTEFPIPTAFSNPQGIAAGSDGNLWFTEFNANQVGRITTAGVIMEFPVPTTSSSTFPHRGWPGRQPLVHRERCQ